MDDQHRAICRPISVCGTGKRLLRDAVLAGFVADGAVFPDDSGRRKVDLRREYFAVIIGQMLEVGDAEEPPVHGGVSRSRIVDAPLLLAVGRQQDLSSTVHEPVLASITLSDVIFCVWSVADAYVNHDTGDR